MVNWNKINKKVSIKKVILPIFIVGAVLLVIAYSKIIETNIEKNSFASALVKTAEKNEQPTFTISKIELCSSANAIDTTDEQKLGNLELYQYTDIAVYINNFRDIELEKENTIKQLYIDNIDLELQNNSGDASLLYTNPNKIGDKEQLKSVATNLVENKSDKIDFNIVSTNAENNIADYDSPTFYADCSNPITLKYINKLNKDYSIGKDNSTMFDGSILRKAGVSIEDINCKIKFKINIVNNNNEYHSAWVNFQIPLDDIYKGVSIKSKTTVGNEYNFFTL